MKRPNNFWTYVKVSLLVVSAIAAFAYKPRPTDSGDNPPLLWLTIMPIVFLGLFLPLLLRASKTTEQYLQASPWPASPLSPFEDPFPFWHLCAWASLAGAVPETYHALTPYNHDHLTMALFLWSGGTGALIGIAFAKRGLRRRRTAVEPPPRN